TNIALSYLEKISTDLRKYFEMGNNNSPELERVISRLDNFEHLLVQLHAKEIQMDSPSPNLKKNNFGIASRSKWRTRAFNFRRNIVNGTAAERGRYITYLSKRILFRIGLIGDGEDRKKIISTISNIKKAGLKVVVFPATVDYSYMMQRPQGMAEAFANAGFMVIYGTLNRQTDNVKILKEVSENFYLLNENYFCYLGEIYKAEEIIYFCMWPNNIKHVDILPHSFLIYDVMDELELLELDPESRQEEHEKLLTAADLVTVSSDNLLKIIPNEFRQKVILVGNGVSSEFISLVQKGSDIPHELQNLEGSTIVGYYGAIAEWMDFELIEFLLQNSPDICFVFIGPISHDVSSKVNFLVNKYKNIVLLPKKNRNELIPYLNRFNVCIIPFVKNKITDSVSPVKLFEYFSAQKPVVSTAINEVYKYKEIFIAQDYNQFLDGVYIAANSKEKNKNLLNEALENTWESKVRQIIKFIC
ncbi:hypothetical protein, partial [Polynucleobacter sp. MG-27-Goln-C1]|uniref:hypothetical protein n=1 Tax=Polynucleobacter sp. MG-27-Goln-C1 TaxID=1819726 RepID=UPI001C0D395A